MTADFILSIVENEQLAQQGQQLFKQLKSRYADRNQNSHFILGVNKGLQKYFELATTQNMSNKIEETSLHSQKKMVESVNDKREKILQGGVTW